MEEVLWAFAHIIAETKRFEGRVVVEEKVSINGRNGEEISFGHADAHQLRNNMGLILHCGAKPVSEKVVRAVKNKPKSKTHEPLAHGDFIDMTRQCLRDLELKPVKASMG